MIRGIFLSAIGLALFHACTMAQDVQARADALLERARQLEDIRSPNAPSFRLQASFSFMGDDLEPVHGTYTETWVSNAKWRQETVVGDQRSIAVGGSGKQWVLVPEGFPSKTDKLPILMTFLPPASLELHFQSISELSTTGLTAECAFTVSDAQKFRSVFCFEKKTGLLLQKLFPEKRPRNVVSFSCAYGSLRKFGEYFFPGEVACSEDQHKSIHASVLELSLQPSPDAAQFEPPAGAVEVPECSGKMVAPYLVRPGFGPLLLDPDRISWIPVWLIVDAKGKVQNVRVLRSLDPTSYKKAVSAAHDLSFAPGTCNGLPTPMPITLSVSTR